MSLFKNITVWDFWVMMMDPTPTFAFTSSWNSSKTIFFFQTFREKNNCKGKNSHVILEARKH